MGILAIKQVPVDTDLQEIIKEISIMQQCDSPYVVKYYGSYFKNTDLWIVMEYCGAGSVLDIMKLRGLYWNFPKGEVKTLSEDEIATVLSDTLKGLEYLHLRKKIHRDIKAGNILLNMEGHAKLADFGVAGQLTDTMAKRNTVIGTPFWMAQEVIQEIGYDCVADIWSLGITALEMAEGKAPYGEIHPMRAIFMIPSKPPPSFSHPDKWSPAFIDFVSRCLVKQPDVRATASELLQHEFIKNSKPPEILADMIREAQAMKDTLQNQQSPLSDEASKTIVPGDSGTLVKIADELDDTDGGTMIQHATLTNDNEDSGSMIEIESNLGTMVINEDEEDTMQKHGTQSAYRPEFLDHFDQKDKDETSNTQETTNEKPDQSVPEVDNQILQKQLQQIAGGQPVLQNVAAGSSNPSKFQQCIAEGDLEFLKYLSYNELTDKMGNLDQEMEREIDDLRRRYHAKRQPILDAMDQKRKRQQNF